jgi:hypothetical protein
LIKNDMPTIPAITRTKRMMCIFFITVYLQCKGIAIDVCTSVTFDDFRLYLKFSQNNNV